MKTPRLLLTALTVSLYACASKGGEPADPKPLVTVKVAKVTRADVQILVSAAAVLHPREQANVTARMTAPIREIRIKKGDTVKAGQLLAVLDSKDVQAQRNEAEAIVNDAETNLQKTKSGSVHLDVERATGQLQAAQAAYNQAQTVLDRRQDLFKQGAIPQRDLLVAKTERETMKANLEVARKNLELLQGEKEVRIAESKVKQAGARLQLQEAQLGFTQIRSPFAGTVTEQFVYPGDMASASTPLFTVMDLSVVIARLQIPESQARLVHPGQPCTFAPADAIGGSYSGRITVLNRAVDLQRRTVEGWCEIPNKDDELRGGASGTVSVVCGTDVASLVIPQTAVLLKEGTKTGAVLVVDDKHVAHQKEIQVGVIRDEVAQVKGGLTLGETVVTEGGYNTPDGTPVTIAETPAPDAGDKIKPGSDAK